MSNLINVNSVVKLNLPKIRQLTDAQITALEQTAEDIVMAVFTAVVQGILVAGLSTYVNQLIKQTNKEE